MSETYVLQPGKKWEIDYEVMLNPRMPLNPDQMTGYLNKATQQQLQAYQKALAEKQLTNPLLMGWNITNLKITKYSIVRCTSLSCVQETNNAGFRFKVQYAMIVDGTAAKSTLTMDVNNYSTWWDHDVLWITTFLNELWKTSPFFTLYQGIKWLGYKIYQAGKATVNWFEKNWKLLILLAIGVGFLFITQGMRGKLRTWISIGVFAILAYWLIPLVA